MNKFSEWFNKNAIYIAIGLLVCILFIMLYLAIRVPLESYSCLNNPINYYEDVMNTTCWCTNMQILFG